MSPHTMLMLLAVNTYLQTYPNQTSSITSKRFRLFKKKDINFHFEHLPYTVTVRSPLDCAILCSKTSGCPEYKYQDTNRTCYRGVNGLSKVEKTESGVTSFYHIECGKAPELPGTQKNSEGQFVGAVTTYTCLPDYIPCHNKTTSVCQSTGRWEKISDLCRQFRWHNLKCKKSHKLEDRSRPDLNVTILATPLKKTRFTVDFMIKRVRLLTVDYRFTFKWILFKSYENTFVMNAFFNKKWCGEVVRPMELFPGRETSMLITFKNSIATLYVDGKLLMDYKLPMVTIPDYISFKKDMSVRLMEIGI